MNEVHLRGTVKTLPWRYNGNLYIRLSVRRDNHRPGRTAGEGGNFDYVTVMIPGGANQGIELRRQQVVSVHGWLQSRDFHETLTEFLSRANGAGKTVGDQLTVTDEVEVHRSVVEVVADRWHVEGEVRVGEREATRLSSPKSRRQGDRVNGRVAVLSQ